MVAVMMRTSTCTGLVPPKPHERPLFEHAQQLRLQTERGVADLVEEERAAGGFLDQSFFAAAGVGEGALLVAEQFTLQ